MRTDRRSPPATSGAGVGSGSVPWQRHCVWARDAIRSLDGGHPVGDQSLRERGPQAVKPVETYATRAVGLGETELLEVSSGPETGVVVVDTQDPEDRVDAGRLEGGDRRLSACHALGSSHQAASVHGVIGWWAQPRYAARGMTT